MDFSDEPYVRLYPRKTLTWKLLGWEGRAVRNAMLDGEFDAAGIFEFRGDAAASISAVTDIPIDIVRVGLQRLIETETWIVTARVITWPTYEEAQNCRRSDRLRQRESRRARSAQSVTDVTSKRDCGHNKSQAVTTSHPPSLPPSLPEKTTTRAHAQRANPEPGPCPSPEAITEVRVIGSGGVARTYSIKGLEPTKSYLDSALMAGIGQDRAVGTWNHYATQGLPPNGVEDLEPWMVLQAKGFAQRNTKLAPAAARAGPQAAPPPKGRPGADVLREAEAAERAREAEVEADFARRKLQKKSQ